MTRTKSFNECQYNVASLALRLEAESRVPASSSMVDYLRPYYATALLTSRDVLHVHS